ncbi:hypothetical protein CLV24_102355 [Pontibacter ummariensis]|uniref:Uncharacterized protein n=1 Tax=Pontibacter ummariensis TaxID=1610492 RepID=A0A239BM92_9BACT|nr:hypothetical protein [Pontibacter ummariensis]PRY15731.1 hypothetical protein CLV24_102355 [Pontibacter ummariensis]SNS09265.1 hypothetical protein SAMN06296052_10257 [Pontibacter ummariensis]
MEVILVILLILAGVAFFLIREWFKAFNTPDVPSRKEADRQGRTPQAPPRPATSFEDILRELQPKAERMGEKGQKPVAPAPEKPREVARPLVPVAEEKPKYKSYEKPIPAAVSLEEKTIPGRKQVVVLQQETPPRRFDPYARGTERTSDRMARMLRNPTTARDAIILSEIFNRKY